MGQNLYKPLKISLITATVTFLGLILFLIFGQITFGSSDSILDAVKNISHTSSYDVTFFIFIIYLPIIILLHLFYFRTSLLIIQKIKDYRKDNLEIIYKFEIALFWISLIGLFILSIYGSLAKSVGLMGSTLDAVGYGHINLYSLLKVFIGLIFVLPIFLSHDNLVILYGGNISGKFIKKSIFLNMKFYLAILLFVLIFDLIIGCDGHPCIPTIFIAIPILLILFLLNILFLIIHNNMIKK